MEGFMADQLGAFCTPKALFCQPSGQKIKTPKCKIYSFVARIYCF